MMALAAFDSTSRLLTASEVAELLSMRVSTVEDYARRAVLPSFKIGRHRRFVERDILDFIDGLRNAADIAA